VPELRRASWAIAVVAVAVLTAAIVVVLAWSRGGGSSSSSARNATNEVVTQATMTPAPVLFGDTVRANIDVVLDAERIDPSSVRAAADFSPWDVVGQPKRKVVLAGNEAYVRTTFVLRCLSGACVPSGRYSVYEFDPARVSFARRIDGVPEQSSVDVRLPSIRTYSRLTEAMTEGGTRSAPWQMDLLSLPAPTLRIRPGVLVPLLLLGALAATLGALAVAYVAWPSVAELPPPPPPPPPPPEPALSPLEQALLLLENAVRVNGTEDERRALELVAEELERDARGDPALAKSARALAWSEAEPAVAHTTELAARVRALLDDGEPDLNGDRHA